MHTCIHLSIYSFLSSMRLSVYNLPHLNFFYSIFHSSFILLFFLLSFFHTLSFICSLSSFSLTFILILPSSPSHSLPLLLCLSFFSLKVYDPKAETLTLTFKQSTPTTPGQEGSNKLPLLIPIGQSVSQSVSDAAVNMHG